jgi:predicted protein tyrosine phosphatase
MNIRVSPRDFVNQLVTKKHDPNTLVISVTDPKSVDAKINLPEDQILRLKFHDLETTYPGKEPHIIFFNKNMADDIKLFIFKELCRSSCSIAAIRDRVKQINVVVHCEAGISRSPAIAGALAKHFNGDCSEFFKYPYIPNRSVYKILLDTINGQDNDIPPVEMRNGEDFFDSIKFI